MLKIGHRGASGYEPENTLASFRRAMELGADMIEFDVQLSRDGELVVIHDETLGRTTKGRGKVADKTLKELEGLDAGNEEKIPTLKQVLDLVDGRVAVNIELKGPGTAVPTGSLLKEYLNQKNGVWRIDKFLVSSFNHDELARLSELGMGIRIGVLQRKLIIKTLPALLKTAHSLNAYSINIPYKRATADITDEIHRQGFKVLVWLVNSEEDIGRMKDLKVDGIFSDYPDRLK